MTLSEKQQEFTKCIAELILRADQLGYGLTVGDAFRDHRAFGQFGQKRGYSHKNSMHKIRLAMDFNLHVNGEYIKDGDHPAYKEIGEFWETLNTHARWGGRFNDANHFSFEHWGCA